MSYDRILQVSGRVAISVALSRMTSTPNTTPPVTGTRGGQDRELQVMVVFPG
jgi:hypothetical protein